MEPFEIELKNALSRAKPLPAAELAALNNRIIQTFARKQKGFFRLMAIYLLVLILGMIALLAMFMITSDLKLCLLIGIIVLIFFESTVLMKLWFWIMHGKVATMREIKLLQLAVAELKAHLRPEPPGTVPAFPTEPAPDFSATPPAPAARKWWRIILPSLWLLAVAGLCYWGWPERIKEPRDMTPYFEKTVTAAEAASGKEWEQTFEVTRAREHFYPSLVSSGKDVRVWISTRTEGGEPMYTGPVDTQSRITFGHPALGRYVVKGRAEQADGDFTVRIGGVDEVPAGNLTFGRVFFMMLCAALVVAIPLLWLQDRWLRRIDPELEN
jgi:hypothetical protein